MRMSCFTTSISLNTPVFNSLLGPSTEGDQADHSTAVPGRVGPTRNLTPQPRDAAPARVAHYKGRGSSLRRCRSPPSRVGKGGRGLGQAGRGAGGNVNSKIGR